MKFLFTRIFLTIVLSASTLLFMSNYHVQPKPSPAFQAAPVTFQKLATHMITYFEQSGRGLGECTGLAIGPHALMTAAHCYDESTDFIRVDYSKHKYQIVAKTGDDRDHEIYLLDGPAFTNFYPVEKLKITNEGPAVGELLYIYGDREMSYPPTRLEGTLDVERAKEDTSDVDRDAKMYWLTIPVLRGDSGAAVFGSDGRVVALVTYLCADEKEACVFSLNFSAVQLEVAKKFDIEEIKKQLEEEKKKK